METTRLSTKGQIVLPLSIRTSHAWEPGLELTIEETGDGILLRPVSVFPETTLNQVSGCLPVNPERAAKTGKRDAIDREIKRRHDSGRY